MSFAALGGPTPLTCEPGEYVVSPGVHVECEPVGLCVTKHADGTPVFLDEASCSASCPEGYEPIIVRHSDHIEHGGHPVCLTHHAAEEMMEQRPLSVRRVAPPPPVKPPAEAAGAMPGWGWTALLVIGIGAVVWSAA